MSIYNNLLFQTGALEGQNAILHKAHVSLSEQQLIDCSTMNNGCQGGSILDALFEMTGAKIFTEQSYPYHGIEGTCTKHGTESSVHIKGYKMVIEGEDFLKNAVG